MENLCSVFWSAPILHSLSARKAYKLLNRRLGGGKVKEKKYSLSYKTNCIQMNFYRNSIMNHKVKSLNAFHCESMGALATSPLDDRWSTIRAGGGADGDDDALRTVTRGANEHLNVPPWPCFILVTGEAILRLFLLASSPTMITGRCCTVCEDIGTSNNRLLQKKMNMNKIPLGRRRPKDDYSHENMFECLGNFSLGG